MTVSVAKLEARRAELRRSLKAKHEQQAKLFKDLDAKEDLIADLQSKLTAINGGGNEDSDSDLPTAEETTKNLNAARDEYRGIRNKLLAVKEEIADLKAEADQADELYADAQEHNRLAAGLSSSGGTPGNDGARLEDDPTASNGSAGLSDDRQARVLPPDNETLDYDLGCYFQAQVIAQIEHASVAEVARQHLRNERVALYAAQQANDFSRGGAWVQGVYLDRFVELLRPMSIVRAAGLDSVPLDDGTLTMPEETAGPAGKYLGEGETADTEEVKTGQIKLIAKELVVQIVSSEKLMRSPSANAAARFRNSVLRGAGQTEDLYFLRGTPSGAGPTGLRYLAPAANVIPVNATVNLQNIDNDLGKAELALMEGNVVMTNAFWVMAPRTMVYLQNLRDGNGNLVYPTLSDATPRLRGKRVFITTQIPVNLSSGGTANESEIILCEPSHNVIGDVPRVEFESSKVAAYNMAGSTKAAFSNRQIVSRLVMENDLQTLQKKSIAVLTEVDWGA